MSTNYITTILFFAAAFAPFSQAFADSRREALALFIGVRQNLQKYECFRVCYTETRHETGQTVSQIVDFDHGKMRKEHLQNDEGFSGWVAVVNETDMCSFRRNIDHEDARLDSPKSLNATMSGLYDPRQLMLSEISSYDIPFGSRLYTTISSFAGWNVQVNSIETANVSAKQILLTDELEHWEYWISEP